MQIRRFGHGGLAVRDLDQAEAFYAETLGFPVLARYPSDGEIMLGVGDRDHLLLQAGPASGGAGVHHLAFELREGARDLALARRRLADRGIAYEEENHGGDAALYFRDPSGNLLEVYAPAGSTRHFSAPADRLAAARRFLYAHARAVDRRVLEHRFGAPCAEAVTAALSAYGNSDGGFGHGLEPDVRCPGSQPLHTVTALELLHQADIRSATLADVCCAYLARVAGAAAALPALAAEALQWPAAAHWQGPFATEPGLGWTMGAVAELRWHGATHPWLVAAVAACREALAELPGDAHQLLYVARFAEQALAGDEAAVVFERVANALPDAAFYSAATPVRDYRMTPLHFAPHPSAALAKHFGARLITAHLDDLLDAQQGDGGWPIRFHPAPGAAADEWRGRWTLEALLTLRAYGRL